MQFALLIQGSPTSSQSLLSAHAFACSAITSGHSIQRAFFYHDAVLIGSDHLAPPQDEPNVQALWQALGSEHDIPLILCVASCLRRGILDEREAQRFEKPSPSLAKGFEIGGLGQLIDGALNADRTLTFLP
ncbi:MAG: sulfurtransferase complex subunit TusD [Pseudomonadales bacterium]